MATPSASEWAKEWDFVARCAERALGGALRGTGLPEVAPWRSARADPA